MFIRKGQALGSVDYTRSAELRAERPKKVAPEEPVVEAQRVHAQSTVTASFDVEPEPAREEVERPKDYEPKGLWVDWAVAQGADKTEAESLTKNELIELYGGSE